MMVGVIDYGVCNVGSIINMLRKIGAETKVVSSAEELKEAGRLILPGVGSFDHGMNSLEERNLVEGLGRAANQGIPILGICLGMQLLGRSSEEGKKEGLALMPVTYRRFHNPTDSDTGKKLKVPHMGWDMVEIVNESPLSAGISFPQRYYFVHSYYAVCEEKYSILSCEYGHRFTAAVRNGNIYGVQFHPEKSHNFGFRILKNFVERCG